MFAAAFFGKRYFGERYFGDGAAQADGDYFGDRHFGSSYFGPRYFGGVARPVPPVVHPGAGGGPIRRPQRFVIRAQEHDEDELLLIISAALHVLNNQ